jgi:acyl-CoA thioesterase-1
MICRGKGLARAVAAAIGVVLSVHAAPAGPERTYNHHMPAPSDPQTGAYDLRDAHLDAPFWRSKSVYGESVLFLQETDGVAADGTLLFTPGRVLRIRDAGTGTVYEERRDYTVDAARRRLVLTAGSRIPFLKRADLHKHKDAKNGIPHKVGDPETWLLFGENGFHEKQVEVDYERAEAWTGYVPRLAAGTLPRVLGKLRAKEEVRVAVTGDSISTGANASRSFFAPHQPGYPDLLAAQLERVYGGPVRLLNVSVGGAVAHGAMESIPPVNDYKPDLVIVAYGMNDVGYRDPARYKAAIKAIIDAVREKTPDAEFILVATSRANPEWSATPIAEFARYRDALSELTGPHVALADVTVLWSQMLERKRYQDLTGNGVNHPNDFGHRVYAQALLGLLTLEGT